MSGRSTTASSLRRRITSSNRRASSRRATSNRQPMSTTIALGPGGSEAAGIATPDGQFVVDLAQGAIARVERRHIRRRPHHTTRAQSPAAGTRRAAPERQRVPRRHDVRAVRSTGRDRRPGTLLVEIPELGNHLFLSPDATTWTPVTSQVASAASTQPDGARSRRPARTSRRRACPSSRCRRRARTRTVPSRSVSGWPCSPSSCSASPSSWCVADAVLRRPTPPDRIMRCGCGWA